MIGRIAAILLSLVAFWTSVASAEPGAEAFAGPEGAKVYYVEAGVGSKAIVLIHGWSCDRTVWKAQIPVLERQYRVLALDMPGFGRSDKPDVLYDIPTLARGVVAVVKKARAEKVVLVGHSMAFAVALTAAAELGDIVAGVVSVDGGVFPSVPDEVVLKRFSDMAAGVRGADHDAVIIKMLMSFSDKLPPGMRRKLFARMLTADPKVAAGAMENFPLAPIWRSTSEKSSLPILGLYAVHTAEQIHAKDWFDRRFEKATLHVWDDIDHWPHLTHSKRVNQEVLSFAAATLGGK
ncbi:putative Alpha/beta hydrolase [Azospirillaceae bacterium]